MSLTTETELKPKKCT